MAHGLRSLITSLMLVMIFALIRRYLPRDQRVEASAPDDSRSLPYGVAGAIMWALGLLIAFGGYFALVATNHWMAQERKQAILTLYPVHAIWCFLPGFAALLVPWIVTLWLLRRFGYAGQASQIVVKGNQKTGWNGERLMHLLLWVLVLPIGLFTFAALPEHFSVFADEIHVTHYARLSPEVFRFADARAAYQVDGYRLRDGTFKRHPDLVLYFADGRHLSANAVGDGGSSPTAEMVSLFLNRSHLQAIHVHTQDELP